MSAIGHTKYQKHTAKWFIGKTVRTRYELRNGYTVIPKGSLLTIVGKSAGFLLEGKECEHCGVKVLIGRVDPWAVELIEEAA